MTNLWSGSRRMRTFAVTVCMQIDVQVQCRHRMTGDGKFAESQKKTAPAFTVCMSGQETLF